MAQTNANVVATQIEKTRSTVKKLFEQDDMFWSMVEKRPVDVISSRDMRVPLEIRPGGAFGMYDLDGGDMGRGSAQSYEKGLINTASFRIAIEWTKLAAIATDSSEKAVIKATAKNIARAMSEFRANLDAISQTDGTGTLGTASVYTVGGGAAVNSDRITLGSDGFGAKLVRFNQKVNIYNAALTVNRTLGLERTINFWDVENKIIDVTPSLAGGIATDKIVISGVSATPPVSLLGIPYHHSNASTGTWLGLSRVTNPEIRASRVAAGGALSLPFPRLAVNKVGNRVGLDNMSDLIAYMHPCQVDAYEQLAQAVMEIHKSAKEESVNLYFNDDMQMAGCSVMKNFRADKTRIDFINKSLWGKAELDPVDYYTEDGRKLFPLYGASGGIAAATIFYLKTSFNLFVDNPAGCAYIDGLAVPAGY
jgi:hypothetical protein